MNKINPKKLLNSKWTAVEPKNKEKHFIISDIEFEEANLAVVSCAIEAVLSKRVVEIDWRDLQDDEVWVHGWQ